MLIGSGVLRSIEEEVLVQLYQCARACLAAHQIPKRWYVVKENPRSVRGKVNREEVGRFCQSLTSVRLASSCASPIAMNNQLAV